jgi:hypothetical protein
MASKISGISFVDFGASYESQPTVAPPSGYQAQTSVSVALLDASGNVLQTATPDANGNYSFSGLANGTYALLFETPTILGADEGAVQANGYQKISNITVDGTTNYTINQGYYFSSTLTGVVNGASGSGQNGVTVNLLLNGTVVATTTTATSGGVAGSYSFSDLDVGTYQVQVVSQGGGSFAGATGTGPANVVVTPGAGIFGNPDIMAPVYTLGTVASGDVRGIVTTPDGAGFNGLTVELLNSSGTVVATTTTNSSDTYAPGTAGAYSFKNVAAGNYTVEVVAPAGQTFYASNYTVPSGQAFASNNQNATKSVTATSGGDSSAVNFTLAVQGQLATGGTGGIAFSMFQDTNNDGVQEPNEGSLTTYSNIDLYSADGTTFYAGGGVYGSGFTFTSVPNGTYLIHVPFNYGGATENGFLGPESSFPSNWIPVTVANGQVVSLNAAFSTAAHSASYYGTVYTDANGNGIGDSNEGTAGVTVALTNSANQVVATTVTGTGGSFDFTGLNPGSYSISVMPPSGEGVVNAPTVLARTLGVGQTNSLWPQSIILTQQSSIAPSLSGTIFLDAKANGALDSGETGVGGVNVALINGSGNVVETATTNGAGQYTFANVEAGSNYRIVVAPPEGYAGANGPTTSISALKVNGGQSLSNESIALVKAAATNQTTPVPAKAINIVVTGQSNTEFPSIENETVTDPLTGKSESVTEVTYMGQQIAYELGFKDVEVNGQYVDGKAGDGNATVNIVAEPNQTEYGGSALTTDWLSQNGTYQNGWSANTIEESYLSALNQVAQTSAAGTPTAILSLHNEFDSQDANPTTAEWESAVEYQAGLARAVLGLTPAEAPYLFISPIPFNFGGNEPVNNQAIAVGQQQLAADPSFDAKVVTQQSSDVTMDHDGSPGGYHMNLQDREAVYGRAALGVAEEFATSALAGSPLALAGGNAIDSQGPQVVSVQTAASNSSLAANQLLLTVAFDQATSLNATLSQVAADGTGWSLRQAYTQANPDATATAARIVGSNQILLTFNNNININDRLFYTWGSLRLDENNGTGNGNAIYDNNGMPLSVSALGLAVDSYSIVGPTISGTRANQTTSSDAAINPFAGVIVADSNAGALDTLTISLSGTGGTLTGQGLITDSDGDYTLSGSAQVITSELQALTFTPTAPSGAPTGTTTFQLSDVSTAYVTPTVDTTTSVVDVEPAASNSKISGVVFLDFGAQDEGQPTSLAGDAGPPQPLTIKLLSANGTVLQTTTSSASDGSYSFTGLASGTYSLVFMTGSTVGADEGVVQPDGSHKLSGVSVNGFDAVQINQGLYFNNSLTGIVDSSSGAGANGVTVNLLLNGTIVATTTTATVAGQAGTYRFSDLDAETYQIQVVSASGGTFAGASTSGPANVAVPVSGSTPKVPVFTLAPSTDVRGVISTPEGEGYNGLTVELIDSNNNVVATTTTNASDPYAPGTAGAYSFSKVAAGSYKVEVLAPNGQVFYATNYGTPSGQAFATDQKSATQAVTVASGQDVSGENFTLAAQGTLAAGSGSIQISLFQDVDGNGVYEPNDPSTYFFANTDLYSADGTTEYASTGFGQSTFSFNNVPNGTYLLRVPFSYAGVAENGVVATDNSNWVPVQVANGKATILNEGFAYPTTVTYYGTVVTDTTSSGNGGQGTAGVTVALLNGANAIVATSTTDSSGNFSFGHLAPGSYTVVTTPPAGYAVADGPTALPITLIAGATNIYDPQTIILAPQNSVASSVSGTVYLDANANNSFDSGEKGIAGANVALINAKGNVVETATTNASGQYSFANVEAGTGYKVVISPPEGYVGESGPTTSLTNVTVTAGQATSGGNIPLVASPATVATPSQPSKAINVVVTGQSNTYFSSFENQPEIDPLTGQQESVPELAFMGQQIAQQLGFTAVTYNGSYIDGKAGDPVVNIVAEPYQTEYPGTGLLGGWLTPNGTYQNGWSANSTEENYLTALNKVAQSAPGTPTAILSLHNENDSDINSLDAAQWESAVEYQAGLARAVLGLTPAEAPYLFVSPIPFDFAGSEPQNNQAIAVGQQQLAADPTFDAKVVTLQSSDVTMNHDGANGTAHLNVPDREAVYGRAALGIAQEFATSALAGSPIALSSGNTIDSQGPQVVGIESNASNSTLGANQLLLTVSFDQATSLDAQLSAVAADGAGWSLRQSYMQATADATATSTQVIGTNQILLTFNGNVNANDRLFYAWGSLRLDENNETGNGNAIYDNNGLPLSVSAVGLPVASYVIFGPTISGTVANQTTYSETPIKPFASVFIADSNAGAIDTLTIGLSGAGGTLTGQGLIADNDGKYTLTGSAQTIDAELNALTFTPTAGVAGTSATTTFQLSDTSTAYVTPTVDQVMSVIDVDPGSSAINGTVANQTTAREAPIAPFSKVTITDVDPAATDTLTITLVGGGGTLSGNGLVANKDGSYTLSGAAATVTSELEGLSFTPTAGPDGTTSTTTFTLSDVSSVNSTPVVDTTISVIDSDTLAPTIAGTKASQATRSEHPITPFAGVTISDPNSGASDTATITLSGAGGTFAGLASNSDGTYTLSGSAASLTQQLQSLSFTPAAGAPGTSSTTQFTLSVLSSAFATPATDTTTSVIDTDPGAPTITGTKANQTTASQAAITPFATVTLSDPNAGAIDTVTISLSGAGGSLIGKGLNANTDGTYTLVGSAAALTSELDATRFTPNGTPGASSATVFTLLDQSSGFATPATDSTTSVIDTDPAAPTISGTKANQTTTSEAPIQPFSTVTLGDPNSGATDNVTISLSGAGGTLAGAGLLANANGTYTLKGAPATLTDEIDALTFTPTAGAPGTSSVTTFSLFDTSSGSGTPAIDSTTFVVDSDPSLPTSGAPGGSTGVTSATPLSSLDATSQLVERLYLTLLDRSADQAGLSYFDGLYNTHPRPATLHTIAQDLMASNEYHALQGGSGDRAFVTALYEGALGSAPSASDLRHDVHELHNGTSRAALAVSIAEGQGAIAHLAGHSV